MKDSELVSTKYAAHVVGISETYFRQLAAQPEPVEPQRLKGSRVVLWTENQVKVVGGRVKTR
jgi:hypothetical protein